MTAATTETGPASDRRIPYAFDPTPKLVRQLRREKKLKRGDAEVLGVLLSFRRAFRDSCWCSVPKIAAELGISERTVQYALARLEAAGVIRQVRVAGPNQPDPDEPRNRTGWRVYFLFITERTDLPPGPDRRPPEERRRGDSAPRDDATFCIISPPEMMQGIASTPDAGFCIQSEDSLSSNRDASEDREGPDADLAQRQRREALEAERPPGPGMVARSEAESAAPIGMPWHWQDRRADAGRKPVSPFPEAPAPIPAADPAAAGAEALTEGQRACLGRLDADQRARLDAMSPAKRAAFLEPHRHGFDEDGFRKLAASELAACRAAIPPPEMPQWTFELIGRLPEPGVPREWTEKAADWMADDFGTKRDRRLFREFHRIALAVWRGRLDPALVVNAWRQAMADGIENRGAKFWKALCCLASIDTHKLRELAEGGR
jgi:hypothetical protein